MKTAEENAKGFRVIKISRAEVNEILGGYGICDFCNKARPTGYYIAVLNSWYCPECYNEWMKTAKRYDEDIPFEERNFQRVKRLME